MKKVLIVGGGLGGLSTAIHLRLMGFEVELYEKNSQVGGRANRIIIDGFVFDTGPSLINYPWVFEQLFQITGAKLSDYVELLHVDPSLRYYWGKNTTLELSSCFDVLVEQFSKFESNVAIKLLRFIRDNSARYRLVFDRLVTNTARSYTHWLRRLRIRDIYQLGLFRSLDTELARYFNSEYIRCALGAYAMYLGGSPYELPGTFSILPFGELYYGLWYPRGGVYKLVEAVAQRAKEIGVAINCNTKVLKILTHNSQAVGIELADGTRHTAQAVISNVDVPTSFTLVDNSNRIRMRRYRMTPGVITFYWGVNNTVHALHHHCVFLPSNTRKTYKQLRNRLPDEIAFYISVPSKSDPSVAPPGRSTVFVLVPTPTLSQVGNNYDWESAVGDVRRKVIERLAHHGLDFDQTNVCVEHVWTPVHWHEHCGVWDGSAFGLVHTVRYIGPGRLPNRDPHIRRLYYVGASTVPGTGLPMVLLSGMMVAREVANDFQ